MCGCKRKRECVRSSVRASASAMLRGVRVSQEQDGVGERDAYEVKPSIGCLSVHNDLGHWLLCLVLHRRWHHVLPPNRCVENAKASHERCRRSRARHSVSPHELVCSARSGALVHNARHTCHATLTAKRTCKPRRERERVENPARQGGEDGFDRENTCRYLRAAVYENVRACKHWGGAKEANKKKQGGACACARV